MILSSYIAHPQADDWNEIYRTNPKSNISGLSSVQNDLVAPTKYYINTFAWDFQPSSTGLMSTVGT